jgi:hypothetical protein
MCDGMTRVVRHKKTVKSANKLCRVCAPRWVSYVRGSIGLGWRHPRIDGMTEEGPAMSDVGGVRRRLRFGEKRVRVR